jgi:hypothetical protein
MRRGSIVWLLGGFAVVLIAWGVFSKMFDTNRYKMTVEVETPAGLRTGYAVREVSSYSRPQGVYGAKVKGEAVAVDLPGGQTLFALLSDSSGDPDHGAWVADWALKRDLKPGGANNGYRAGRFAELYPTQPKTESPLRQTSGPMLVRFRDLADPTLVEPVDPENLAASFGPGVRLKRITVETTRDPVTKEIGKRLGWLGKFPEPSLNPNHGPKDFSISATLHHGDFHRGQN